MAADPICQQAYDQAMAAAQGAADTLKINHDDSPLVKELRERSVPDEAAKKPIKDDFTETMNDVKNAADALKAAASKG